MAIRVLIVEDQRIVRELLTGVLANEPDIAVVGEAETGGEAMRFARELAPDVVVLDIGLPDMDGLAVAEMLRRQQPALRVMALSVHDEPQVVGAMLEAGACGYVLKADTVSELRAAIRAVARGETYLSSKLAPLPRSARAAGALHVAGALGARERQVLALLAEGKRSAVIAEELHISIATVDVHRRNIMRKLDLHTVAELTKFALREGLTSL